jgi:site-specific recombinase XerC
LGVLACGRPGHPAVDVLAAGPLQQRLRQQPVPRRDTAIIAVFTATGIRLSEMAGIRYDPGDPRRSDIDLWQREITVRGKGGKDRIVKIGHQAARSLDRYLELNGWASPQMLARYGASARSARARRTYDRIMTDT